MPFTWLVVCLIIGGRAEIDKQLSWKKLCERKNVAICSCGIGVE